MKFNSQICTTREQSERLIALGLKKETADIEICCLDGEIRFLEEEDYQDTSITIPAWSLHRLIEMIQHDFLRVNLCGYWVHIQRRVYYAEYYADTHNNLYDNIIEAIEWLIKEGYFNKEYLV